jgi:hypothetical protein
MTKRLEITAVRRRITRSLGHVTTAASERESSENQNEEVWSTVADIITTNQANSIQRQIEIPLEARAPIDSPTEVSVGLTMEGKQIGVQPNEISLKLRRFWRASLIQLRHKFNSTGGKP